jgi:ribosomal-protein-alanine N-acetyltransferase
MPVTIRPMTAADLGAVYHLGRRAYPVDEIPYNYWTPVEVADHLESGPECCWVAVGDGDGAVAGFLLGHSRTDVVEGAGHAEWIAVDAAHRRQGLAGRLLETLADVFARAGRTAVVTDVAEGNAASLAMASKAGFGDGPGVTFWTRDLRGGAGGAAGDAGGAAPPAAPVASLRPMTVDDLAAVFALGRAGDLAGVKPYSTWALTAVAGLGEAAPDLCWVAERGGRVVAFALGAARYETLADTGRLQFVATAPELRRRGLASALIARVVAAYRARGTARVVMDVARGHPAAPGLAARAGFREGVTVTFLVRPLPGRP